MMFYVLICFRFMQIFGTVCLYFEQKIRAEYFARDEIIDTELLP